MDKKEQKPFLDLEKTQALLGEGSFFEGELRFEGSARIGGRFKGQIKAQGTLIVDKGAKVEAKVEADHFILLGEFSGQVIAKKSVLMEPPARFSGQVSSPSLSIQEGVFFEGSSKKI